MRAHTGGGPGPSCDLVWFGAAEGRGHAATDAFGRLEGHQGVLVRDDYGGYTRFDATLAGVQQCCSHLFRHLADVHDIDADQRAWTDQAACALRAAGAAVNAARHADPAATALDADLPARLRRDHDQAVAVGISTQPLPPLAPRPPPRTRPRATTATQGRPGLAVRHPLRRAMDEQRIRTSRPRRQGPPEDQRLPEKHPPPCSATAASAPTRPQHATTASQH
jgi:hypothetical protein